ncbi:hypothetical protein A9L43_15505 [Pseudomonas mosselii]|nr:hypothetical protein A9L43_15505 [Pseudomonas mosselii]
MPRIQLLGQDAFPGRAAGAGRTRQATHQGAVGQAGQGPALHGRGADIKDRQGAEQLAKPVDALVQQAVHRLRRAVAPGEAGATSDQHHLHLVVGDPGGDLGADLVQVVLEQLPRHQAVAHADGAAGQQLAGGVGVVGAGVADGQHRDVQRYEHRVRFHAHGLCSRIGLAATLETSPGSVQSIGRTG